MKTYSLILLFFCFGCSEKLYNYKVANGKYGLGWYAYSQRGKLDVSKDVLSTGDTLCTDHKPPYRMFFISSQGDTNFIIK